MQNNGDNPLLVSLDQAFDAHAAAGKAQALAANAEVAAAAELVTVLERVEKELAPAAAASSSGAGPSGVVKSE